MFVGPRGMLIGWPIVSILSLFVGLSMAEIVSAFPTSGGLYFWAAKLSPPRWAPFISYFSAWFNFLGLWGTTAATLFDIGELTIALFYVCGWLDKEQFSDESIQYKALVLGLCLVGTLICGWINTLSSRTLNILGQICLVINIAGLLSNVLGTAFVGDAPRTSLSDLFSIWENGTGFPDFYVCIISILPAATLYTGYDSTGHFAEETLGAALSAPLAILATMILALPVGGLTLWGLLTRIPPDLYDTLSKDPISTSPIIDIFVYTQGKLLGSIQAFILILMTFTCSYVLIGNISFF
jgi:amino acid transporter